MLQEKEKVLEELSQLFLTYRCPNEAYCKVSGIISRLYSSQIDITIDEVQSRAYGCDKEVK